MTNIANKQMICNVLMDAAKTDKDIVVLCSDSRGSASATPFANAFPEQFVEVGIAEQDLVGIAAGMARCGKRTFPMSPACFAGRGRRAPHCPCRTGCRRLYRSSFIRAV